MILRDILLIGCFYLPQIGIAVEWARVPFYRGEALALATTDGIVRAVSAEAIRCGVSIGMKVTGARSLCRALVVLPYIRSLYEEAAESVWDLLATESNVVEPISPEVCFVLLSGSDCAARAEKVGEMIASKIGVEVRIGIGSSKVVAEQAARQDGKGPVVKVQLGMEAVFLASIPLSALQQFVPPLVLNRLTHLGVTTLGDILRLPERSLTTQFKILARKLQLLAVGDDGETVKPLWPPPAIEHEVTFDDDIERNEQIFEAVRLSARCVADKLSQNNSYCRKVCLVVTLNDRSILQQSEPLRSATNLASELAAAGLRQLRRLNVDRPVSSIKIVATGLGAGSGVQLTLLSDNDLTREAEFERQRKLEETMIFVRKLFGISAIVPASLFKTMRQAQLMVYPLGQQKREDVLVATDTLGSPVRFYQQKRGVRKKHEIAEIQDQWNQASWSWDKILETHCYRVVTDPWGLHQLEQLGVEWTLTATAD